MRVVVWRLFLFVGMMHVHTVMCKNMQHDLQALSGHIDVVLKEIDAAHEGHGQHMHDEQAPSAEHEHGGHEHHAPSTTQVAPAPAHEHAHEMHEAAPTAAPPTPVVQQTKTPAPSSLKAPVAPVQAPQTAVQTSTKVPPTLQQKQKVIADTHDIKQAKQQIQAAEREIAKLKKLVLAVERGAVHNQAIADITRIITLNQELIKAFKKQIQDYHAQGLQDIDPRLKDARKGLSIAQRELSFYQEQLQQAQDAAVETMQAHKVKKTTSAQSSTSKQQPSELDDDEKDGDDEDTQECVVEQVALAPRPTKGPGIAEKKKKQSVPEKVSKIKQPEPSEHAHVAHVESKSGQTGVVPTTAVHAVPVGAATPAHMHGATISQTAEQTAVPVQKENGTRPTEKVAVQVPSATPKSGATKTAAQAEHTRNISKALVSLLPIEKKPACVYEQNPVATGNNEQQPSVQTQNKETKSPQSTSGAKYTEEISKALLSLIPIEKKVACTPDGTALIPEKDETSRGRAKKKKAMQLDKEQVAQPATQAETITPPEHVHEISKAINSLTPASGEPIVHTHTQPTTQNVSVVAPAAQGAYVHQAPAASSEHAHGAVQHNQAGASVAPQVVQAALAATAAPAHMHGGATAPTAAVGHEHAGPVNNGAVASSVHAHGTAAGSAGADHAHGGAAGIPLAGAQHAHGGAAPAGHEGHGGLGAAGHGDHGNLSAAFLNAHAFHSMGPHIPVTFSPFGFVQTEVSYTTRQMSITQEHQPFLLPINAALDANGVDVEARSQFFVALHAHSGVLIDAPEIEALHAKPTADVSFEYYGPQFLNFEPSTDPGTVEKLTGLFLLHAAIYLEWKKAVVILGETWHPAEDPEISVAINRATLFGTLSDPNNRLFQIRNTLKVGPHFEFITAFCSNIDLKTLQNYGVEGDQTQNPEWFNFHFQGRWRVNDNIFALAADIYTEQPHLFENINNVLDGDAENLVYAFDAFAAPPGGDPMNADPMTRAFSAGSFQNANAIFATRQGVTSFSMMAFAKMDHGPFGLKAKALVGSNLGHPLSGFAIQSDCSGATAVQSISEIPAPGDCVVTTTYGQDLGVRVYEPMNIATFCIDFIINGDIEPGLFLGFTKNMGAKDQVWLYSDTSPYHQLCGPNNPQTLFCFGTDGLLNISIYKYVSDLDYSMTIAPRVKWHLPPMTMSLEIEYTRAAFGLLTYYGAVDCATPVDCLRLIFEANFNF